MNSLKCKKCGTPLEAKEGKGRPASYCSKACRKAAEYEIRRVNALIARLEEDACRIRLGRGYIGGNEGEKIAEEIARAEARLKAILYR